MGEGYRRDAQGDDEAQMFADSHSRTRPTWADSVYSTRGHACSHDGDEPMRKRRREHHQSRGSWPRGNRRSCNVCVVVELAELSAAPRRRRPCARQASIGAKTCVGAGPKARRCERPHICRTAQSGLRAPDLRVRVQTRCALRSRLRSHQPLGAPRAVARLLLCTCDSTPSVLWHVRLSRGRRSPHAQALSRHMANRDKDSHASPRSRETWHSRALAALQCRRETKKMERKAQTMNNRWHLARFSVHFRQCAAERGQQHRHHFRRVSAPARMPSTAFVDARTYTHNRLGNEPWPPCLSESAPATLP